MLCCMARPKLALELSSEQRSELNRLVKAPSTPQKMVLRARIGLLAAEGKDNDEIAAELGTSRVTVGLWRQRITGFGSGGIGGSPSPWKASVRGSDSDSNRPYRSGTASQRKGSLELP